MDTNESVPMSPVIVLLTVTFSTGLLFTALVIFCLPVTRRNADSTVASIRRGALRARSSLSRCRMKTMRPTWELPSVPADATGPSDGLSLGAVGECRVGRGLHSVSHRCCASTLLILPVQSSFVLGGTVSGCEGTRSTKRSSEPGVLSESTSGFTTCGIQVRAWLRRPERRSWTSRKRLGHASSAATLRYIHAVEGRDLEIAKALSILASADDAAKLPRSRHAEDVARGRGRAL
jgi:hypothetical protein